MLGGRQLLLLKVCLSGALLWWVVRSVDFQRLASLAMDSLGAALPLAAALFLLQAALVGWRWHRIVVRLGGQLPPLQAMRWVLVGLFFNQALPTSVGGDVIRVWNLQRLGTAPGQAFASVAVERVTGVAALGWMITLSVPFVSDGLSSGQALTLALAGPAIHALLILLACADRAAASWLPNGVALRLIGVPAGLRRMARPWPSAVEIAILGALASLLVILAAMAIGFDLGIRLGLAAYTVGIGGAILLSVLPISLGGWGVREASMVSLFGAMGQAPEPVLVMSIVWAFLPLLISAPAGLLWLVLHPTAPDKKGLPT